jgi:hypothetical protein
MRRTSYKANEGLASIDGLNGMWIAVPTHPELGVLHTTRGAVYWRCCSGRRRGARWRCWCRWTSRFSACRRSSRLRPTTRVLLTLVDAAEGPRVVSVDPKSLDKKGEYRLSDERH